MDIALSVAAFLLSIVGIVGCIVPALPGVVLSYAGLLCAYFTSYSSMSPAAIWLWLAITVAVSVADAGKAFLVGIGSFLSFVVGTGIKLAAAIGMFVHVTADTYPAVRDWFATLF